MGICYGHNSDLGERPWFRRVRNCRPTRIKKSPFKFGFPPPALLPSLDTATEDFRYWIAAEALRRGADFWGPKVTARPAWFCGPELEVRLDVGIRWDANYERLALNFFHGVLSSGVNIYAAASGDMLCHELGHAMLDAIQDRLWHTVYKEVDAFHESFGDVSAILCALQIPTMRSSILTYTGPNLSRFQTLADCGAIWSGPPRGRSR